MAKPIQRNEEHYVAKMNFRSEKILQNQIQRLNREKLLQVKSLNAQIRSYERKLQKINDRVIEVDKLSRNTSEPSQRLPTRDHFNKLSSDATHQRHMATGVGYSYIDQLLGTSKPLVSRPLRWGINPSLPSLQQQPPKPITLVSDSANSKTFLTEIKGQPIYLRPREAVYLKRQFRPNALVLPPITVKRNQKEFEERNSENSLIPRDSFAEKVKLKELAVTRKDDEKNQDAASQLSPIPENIEETAPSSREVRKNEGQDPTEVSGQKEPILEEKPFGSETANILNEPSIILESSEPLLDKEMNKLRSSSLNGHFTTGYEFPTHGSEGFTRSTETLLVETNEQQNESKANSFRYQLHARRFSL